MSSPDSDDAGLTYEEFSEQHGSYAFYAAVVYDAEGEALEAGDIIMPNGGEGSIRSVFPVQNRDVSHLQIYLFDDFDGYVDSQRGDPETAKELAILSAEI